ncbi:two-component system, NtrC family, response regulator [Pseudobacteriovorax antillogorgiicola]|uniref:Two-component system, NtrC family, response regulator n=2 Tax=Pseudobacteriovorax antillogorgiicola TaxID=1513793 RepID=A0A1Y6C3C3_9BACT|nr:two-component system NtrC family response regulator [Pseudobacteriovorax antillogorgiicola]SMF34893.1 two-component system, NtrC family, response regulator [Pseudobacteriovorax antillogorgiicola]
MLLTDIHLTQDSTLSSFEGFEIIQYAKENHPEVIVIAMSADPKISTYRRAHELGADHWLKKPVIELQELQIAIDAAKSNQYLKRLKRSNSLKPDADYDHICEDGLVISDEVRRYVRGVAKSRTIPCVIYGETGTGKEEVAKLIHKRRTEGEGSLPFMAVNCANLNSNMAASILFGHRKGAFTGAEKTTNGMIGEADGGILFLDEIHRLNEECQSRLLRVLNDGTYQRLGDTKTLHSSFQVITASSKDLDDAVIDGEFLMDLRSRLTGVDIHLLPLRDRPDDFDPLIKLFFARENIKVSEPEIDRIISRCKSYYWQGNIRQLFNVLKSFSTMCTLNEDPLEADKLPEYKTMLAPGQDALRASRQAWQRPMKESLEELEKQILMKALESYRSKTVACQILKMNRSTFDSRVSKYGLQ